jgi:hypothetical protein
MPMLVAEIDRVEHADYGRGIMDYTVTAVTPEKCWQFQTFDSWLASFCQIAHDKQLRMELTYRERLLSRFGKRWRPRLISATLLPRMVKSDVA